MRLDETVVFSPIMTEPHGLTNLSPAVCRVLVFRDRTPKVKIIIPDSEIAVHPDDVVDISFGAEDDHGITKAELVVSRADSSSEGQADELEVIDVPLGDQVGQKSVQGVAKIDLSKYKLENGEVLTYSVRVYDVRGSVLVGKTEQSEQQVPAESDRAEKKRDASPSPPSTKNQNNVEPAPAAESAPRQPNPKAAQRTHATNNNTNTSATQQSKNSSSKNSSPNISNPNNNKNTSADADRVRGPNAEGTNSSASEEQSVKMKTGESPPQPSRDAADTSKRPQQATSVNNSSAKSTNNSPSSESSPSSSLPAPPPPDGQATQPNEGAPRPSDNMPRRGLDVPQSACSQTMRLKIDQWAGNYEGQQRVKLEMAIAPALEDLDKQLALAEKQTGTVVEALQNKVSWNDTQPKSLKSAGRALETSDRLIAGLKRRTSDTPYAFIGLQLVEIGYSHITPAREQIRVAQQTKDRPRLATVRDAWQQIIRARERLAKLSEQFEIVRRENRRKDILQEIKTMYQVFVENSAQLLNPKPPTINPKSRKIAEFDLDEEYLKRLQEVLEMRQAIMAELARILAEDPRLLQRYMNNIAKRSYSLRDQLTLLAERQKEIAEEASAWQKVSDAHRDMLHRVILQKRLSEVSNIAQSIAQLNENFDVWLPLDRQTQDAHITQLHSVMAEVAGTARRLEATAAKHIQRISRTGKSDKTPSSDPAKEPTAQAKVTSQAGAKVVEVSPNLDAVYREGMSVYQQLQRLDRTLRQTAGTNERDDLVAHVANRLVETRRLIEQTSAWTKKMQYLSQGNYGHAVQIEQYQLAVETRQLTDKLLDLQQQLAGMLQTTDGKLPKEIAERVERLLQTMDDRIAPSQLAATYSLRRDDLRTAVIRQQAAVASFAVAEQQFDELLEKVIEELDKLPVEDPIAGLLDDPTLEELLAILENEIPIEELLGIPQRPTNLQIIGDWLTANNGNMGSGGVGVAAQLRQEQQRNMRRINNAYRRAIDHALKRSRAVAAPARKRPRSAVPIQWNKVASKLQEGMIQGRGKVPPERYRVPIEQYLNTISRLVSDDEELGTDANQQQP